MGYQKINLELVVFSEEADGGRCCQIGDPEDRRAYKKVV
jgi:hypothetical protein